MPADNGRFGATAAVTLQKVPCEIERLSPAGRANRRDDQTNDDSFQPLIIN